MSVSTMGTNAEIPIPNGWAGQIDAQPSLDSNRPLTNAAITAALQTIDHDIEQLLSLRASMDGTAGLVTLTDATDVTDSTGKALPASEKNPALEGSLANQINKNKINVKFISFILETMKSADNSYGSIDVSELDGFPQGTFLTIPLLASAVGYFHKMPSIGMHGNEFRVFCAGDPGNYNCMVACLYR